MYDLLSDELAPWFGSAIVLVVGTAIIVAVAESTCRLLKSAIWQRTVWQIGGLGLLALVAVELTGMGTVLARMGLAKMPRQAPAVDSADPERAEPPPAVSGEEVCFPATTFAHRDGVVERFSDESAALDLGGWDDLGSLSSPGSPDFHPRFEPLMSYSDDWEPPTQASETHAPSADGSTDEDPTLSVAADNPLESETVASTGVTGRTPVQWPVAIWTGIALLLLARVVWGRARLVWFGRRCETVLDRQVRDRVERLARRLGLPGPVRVLEAAGLATPAACGLVRPAILLPSGFAARFDGSRQEVILAHELAHLAGRDPVWQFLADVLCAVLWWDPLAYWVRRGLRTSSEAAADEASLLVPGGPDVLAGCLVSLGRQLADTRKLGWLSVGGSGFRSCLGKRVERLLNLSARSWRPPRRRLSAIAKVGGPVLLVFVTISCTVWARSQASLTEGESTMNVLTTSWRRSLAATAVMACLVPLAGGGEVSADGAKDAEHRERERVERREREERDADDHPLVRERAELLERAEEIERRIHELGDGRPDESRELHGELEEIHERIGHLEREMGEGRDDHGGHDVFGELIELRGRALELEVDLHVLPEGREERAEDIRRELEEIRERVGEIEREHPDLPPEVVQRLMHHRLDQLRHAMERLREAGKPETAERMEQEARELAEEIEREPQERPGRPHPEGDEDARHAHVRAALENLRAAGLHDLAEKLAREIERMHGGHPPEPPPHPGDVGPVIEELRGQMHEMRREMDELRGLLKEVLERERR